MNFDLSRARAALPGLAECTYLNVGTYGVPARPVLDRLLALTLEAEQLGTPGYERVAEELELARARLAALLGCDAAELAFTENATHGLNLALLGPPLQPGDELLLGGEEYPISEYIAHYRSQTQGVRVRYFPIAHDPTQTFANFQAAFSERTRLVFASMITCESATRLPVAAICAYSRAHGAWSALDLAQAIGTMPIDLHGLGCDYAIGNGHKWLNGPKGVGLFYARRAALTQITPPFVSHYAGFDPATRAVTLPDDHRRFELVARPYAHYAAMSAALDWLEGFGWAALWQHQWALRAYMVAQVQARPALTLVSPANPEHGGAMVTFRIPGVAPDETISYTRRMWLEHRVYLRASVIAGGIRISAAYFNTADDVDRLFALIDEQIA
ncbi:MAG: aminotransferase class V-fold PLP-dependent enzyme [Chloroflexales bacterium]|nr:aminotransferase class V-fold PLP-dependent enzyme [Chloroflexales bacterium]